MPVLYRLGTTNPESVRPTNAWRVAEYPKMACRECNTIHRSLYPQVIDVVLTQKPSRRICGNVFGVGIYIVHRDFIGQIKPYMNGFVSGQCYWPSGKMIQEYMTCYCKDWIVCRGEAGTHYTECSVCGMVYSSGEIGPRYTLRRYLSDKRIYQDAFCDLYLDEELALSLDFSRWSDVKLELIEICDVPIDHRRLICDPSDPPWTFNKYS